MAADAVFAVGDSYYEEGGTENLLLAEDQYKNFIVFFPTHPKAQDAQLKIVSALMKLMHSPDRDQQYTALARQEAKKFLQQYPDSDYVPVVKQLIVEIEDRLALQDLGVGQFYADRSNNAGAVGRYQEIVDEFKNFSGLDDVYFRLAGIWEKSNNPEQASIYYGKIVSGYPFSKLADEAKARLNSLGKPVPPVDKQLADLNQSRIKPPEGFSPLKPFIDFGKALGFAGPPDRYELAKKTVEAEKVKNAEAEAAKTGEGAQTADDILIQTTIRKSASGETQDSTILGASSTTATPQNNADKKKNTNKRKYVKKSS